MSTGRSVANGDTGILLSVSSMIPISNEPDVTSFRSSKSPSIAICHLTDKSDAWLIKSFLLGAILLSPYCFSM